MSDNFQFVFLFIMVGVIGGSLLWHFSRSRGVLAKWAEANGFEIISSEYRNVFRGPFFWTTSRGQTVYYVKVRNAQGVERSGWVRCGGWWFGLLSDAAEVKWDDEL